MCSEHFCLTNEKIFNEKVFNYVIFIQIAFLKKFLFDLKMMKGILCWYPVSGFGLTNLNLSRDETYLNIQTYQCNSELVNSVKYFAH